MTKRRLRILHVTRLPSTATAFLMPLLRQHRQRHEDVRVACSDGPEIAQLESEGFLVHRYPLRRTLSPWNFAAGLRGLTRIIRDEQVDWVFTHTPIASALARIASRLGGACGTIYMAHGLPCAPRMKRSSWLLGYCVERFLGRFTEGLITTNSYDFELARRERLIHRREHIFRVNEVGVEVERFDRLVLETDAAAVKSELGIPVGRDMVLLLARTHATKGIREFLEAARQLVERGVPATFVLAGAGPLDQEIHAFIARHGVGDDIRFLGWRSDPHRIMTACDIYVLPTYYPEGMPISILEAMACRKPVIATRHRGCEDEVVHDVTGLLVEPKDVSALASAIQSLVADPEQARRFGEAGRARIDDGFRSDQSTAKILMAFDAVVASCGAFRAGA